MNRVFIVFFTLLLASAANWPSFRGPNASGVAEGPAPTTWDAVKDVNVLWKTGIPGLAHSSPIVWGDKVFVTTAISSDPKAVFRHGLFGDVEPSGDLSRHLWKVYCLHRKTGKVLWEKTADEGTPKTKRHPKSSQASSTPATDGKHVVAFFGSACAFTRRCAKRACRRRCIFTSTDRMGLVWRPRTLRFQAGPLGLQIGCAGAGCCARTRWPPPPLIMKSSRYLLCGAGCSTCGGLITRPLHRLTIGKPV